MERGAAEADDESEIIVVALLAQLAEQRERRDRRIVVEAEAADVVVLGEHDVERAQAKIGALAVDARGVFDLDPRSLGPGEAEPVEQRMQDAAADIEAVDRNAGREQTLHRRLDLARDRRVGDAKCDDRGRDIRAGGCHDVVHGAMLSHPFGVVFRATPCGGDGGALSRPIMPV